MPTTTDWELTNGSQPPSPVAHPLRDEAIAAAYAGGTSQPQLGRRYGITQQRVAQILKRHPEARQARRLLDEQRRTERDAEVERQRQTRAARREHARRHGTDYRYQLGCGCQECRAAHAKLHRDWNRRRQP